MKLDNSHVCVELSFLAGHSWMTMLRWSPDSCSLCSGFFLFYWSLKIVIVQCSSGQRTALALITSKIKPRHCLVPFSPTFLAGTAKIRFWVCFTVEQLSVFFPSASKIYMGCCCEQDTKLFLLPLYLVSQQELVIGLKSLFDKWKHLKECCRGVLEDVMCLVCGSWGVWK